MVEGTSQLRYVATVETESVHTGVKLDVYGHTFGTTMETNRLREGFEDAETVDVGLKAVAYNVGKALLLWVHNHNWQRDATLTEFDTLVAIGHSEIVGMVILEGIGNLGSAGTIG